MVMLHLHNTQGIFSTPENQAHMGEAFPNGGVLMKTFAQRVDLRRRSSAKGTGTADEDVRVDGCNGQLAHALILVHLSVSRATVHLADALPVEPTKGLDTPGIRRFLAMPRPGPARAGAPVHGGHYGGTGQHGLQPGALAQVASLVVGAWRLS
ncbi:MAG: hypothetical protein DCC50_12125 [Acidobacteria bacterium]|nr:MAG: hypothetical protein DCC50_12125 [Acidobacteriota bacterium]